MSLPTSGAPTSAQTATSDGQLLRGSSGNDKLTSFGKPGSGTGTLVGLEGDDTYIVYSSKHRIIEEAGQGIDTVQSYWTYTLPENVENLTLIGKGPNSAIGNSLDNIVTGNANKNIIDGAAGNDELTGGGGNDIFFVSGKDTITDFTAGDHVNLQAFTSFTSFAKVKAAMTQVGNDTLLKLNANESVLFEDFSVSQFTSGMFVLGNPADNYDLVFDDEFDTFTLNLGTGSTENWHPLYPRSGLAGHTVIGRSVQYFTYLGDEGTAGEEIGINPFSLKNGVLTITMDRVAPEDRYKVYGYEYTSGNITSIGSFHQTYGYFEIRAKLAAGTGLHDAFWMLPMDGSWPPELDIVEQRGSDPTRLINGVHSDESTTSGTFVVPTATTEFHTYGLDWEPDFLTYYIDGVAVRTIPTPAGMDIPMYMLANLGGGSEWAGDPNSSTPFPAKMQIDYIRAYASENTLERNGPFNKVGTSGADTMYGTIGADTLNGGAGDDSLYGGAGDDTLIGGGGKDLLDGGFGDDTYIVSSGQEKISEGGVKGNDTVKTTLASFTLGLNLEYLIYTGTGTFNGSGNSEDNVITGSAAGGTLNGGAGNDTLNGGAGIDSLNGGDGDDVSYGFGSADSLRGNGGNDKLFGGDGDDKMGGDDGNDVIDGGRGDDNLTGGAGNDTLIGGEGADKLDGGAGVDAMSGGNGDDSYYVDETADTITEGVDGGNDSVRVFASSYVLSANVETMSYGGAGNFTGTGNEIANRIVSAGGNDVLDGKGGADTLTGGAGNDKFLFSRGQADGDRITDFQGAQIQGGDKLLFSGFGKGTITRVGSTDFYEIKADAAHGGGTETIQLSGVTNLTSADYMFDGTATTNSPATNITATNLTVKENATSGTTIGVLAAVDPDAGDTASFKLLDDAGGLFKLSGSELVLVGALSYSTATKHVIKVQTTDSAGNTFSKSLTVTVSQVTTNQTHLGTAGDDNFAYSSGLSYKRIDGLSGSDTFVIEASKLAVSAKGSDLSYDIGANGSQDFATANVEHLILSGSDLSFTGSVASTAAIFGEVTLTGTEGDDTLDGSLAGVNLLINGADGNDVIKGSTEGDTLNGGIGNDKIYANGGADTLRGGEGNDTYYLDDSGQIVIENAGEGTDRIVIKEDYTLGDNLEDLSLSGTFGHVGTGNSLANTLTGSLGDDVLDGKAGADTLTGDAGADTFVFIAGDANGDTVTDFEGAGAAGGDVLVFNGYGNGTITRIGSTDTYLVKADAARGGVTDTIRLVGVTNLSSGDYQFVSSGSSNSAPTGIVASNLSVAENVAKGTIVGVLSSVDPDENDTASFRLTDDAGGRFALNGNQLVVVGALDYEASTSHGIRVQATDSAGNTATRWLTVTVTQVEDDDTQLGTGADDSFVYDGSLTFNRIDGLAGSDTLTMSVNTVSVSAADGDVAIDIDSNGSVDFSTVNVEHLVLSGNNISFFDDLTSTDLMDGEITIAGTGGADSLDATKSGVRVVIDGGDGRDIIKGGDQTDTLVGGADADKLYARGGSDLLVGGTGNDTYYLDDPSQTVVEFWDEGTDRIVARFDYTLGEYFENLTFAGTAGFKGVGNDSDNALYGSGGDDVLDGVGGSDTLFGGKGNDILIASRGVEMLTGGEGSDVFRFTVLETTENADAIADFEAGERIEFAKSAFKALTADADGGLAASEFYRGTEATSADHHLIYDRASGALYYDADGVGGAEQVQVAVFSNTPWLDANDFYLI